MRRIIASLDLGSNSIKLIVGEMIKGKLNVLCCSEVASSGIKQGFIINTDNASNAIKEAFNKCEAMLGVPVQKVLVNIPAYNLDCFVVEGSVTIKSEDKLVKHSDIIRALQLSIYNKIDDNKELVTILPTKYILDDNDKVAKPVNMVANKLTVKSVAVTVPKKNYEKIFKCLDDLDIKVVDICVSPIADFYEFKNQIDIKETGAVVNIGQTSTTVSIFNKGILTSAEVLDVGAVNIDNDIAYVFKTNKKDAVYLRKELVTCDIHRANPAENLIVSDVNKEAIKINQYDVSAVAISRLTEICDLIKKQINLLTKREISYIIIAGGISELSHFDTLASNIFGTKAVIGNITEMGARDNKYSTALGIIKYYDSRLQLRDADFSILSEEEEEELSGKHKRINVNDNSLLGKVFGYFFDN